MPTYKYKAYDSTGRTRAGVVEAHGAKDAATRLKDTGLYPVEVAESGAASRGLFGFSAIPQQLVSLTTRQLATLLASGTTLSEALGVLAKNAHNPALKSTLLSIAESVSSGSSLSKALEAHPSVFSPLYRGLVASGEASGSLDKVLARLADYLETRSRIMRELKTALTYPALMTVVGAGVLVFLFIFVIPKITRIFEDTEATLPLMTHIIISITTLVTTYWPLMLAFGALSVWLAVKYGRHPRVKAVADRAILRLPWLGPIATAFYISNMSRTLGSLLGAGVHLLKALEITKVAINHTVFSRVLDEAKEDCAGGGSLSASLAKYPDMPPILVHMASVGERGGNLDEMLLKAADAYDQEFEAGLKSAVSLLEPLLILAMGLAVGFIVLAILLPIFELNQVIR